MTSIERPIEPPEAAADPRREASVWDAPFEPENGDPGPSVVLQAFADSQTPDAAAVALIEKAWRFAARAHAGQTRESGQPYITHPLAVAAGCAELGLDADTVAAAILHDTVEDTPVSLADLRVLFGEEIAALVDGVTKLDAVDGIGRKRSRADVKAATMRKMLVGLADDLRVLLVKLCDRRHNMTTLRSVSDEKRVRVAQETMDVYVPLAARLGVWQLKSDLEDLAFAALHPEEFTQVRQQLAHRSADSAGHLAQLAVELEELLERDGIDAQVTARTKSAYSAWRKARARHVPVAELHDLLGIRIVCQQVAECYAALHTLHSRFTPVPGTFTDYIATPKFNLYQSLHTTVMVAGQMVEVQLRTFEQHHRAEFGAAAHHAYKPTATDSDVAWLRHLHATSDEVADPDEFLAALQEDLVRDEVYIFTRDGDLLHLSAGATPIDVAYAIHTDVGDRCAKARINGHVRPLRTRLRSGDQVEIITDEQAQPRMSWLDDVATAKARTAIRKALARQAERDVRELGARELKLTAFEHGVDPSTVSGRRLGQAAKAFDLRSGSALAAAVGRGEIAAGQVLAWVSVRGDGSVRRRSVTIVASDRLGLLADVAVSFAEAGVAIVSVTSSSETDGTATLALTVVERPELEQTTDSLTTIAGVRSISVN